MGDDAPHSPCCLHGFKARGHAVARGPGELDSFTSKGLLVQGAPRMIFVWCVHFPCSRESPMSVEIDFISG